MKKILLFFVSGFLSFNTSAQTLSTFAGNLNLLAYPKGLAFDASANMYVPNGSHKIIKVTSSGIISNLAGSDLFGSIDGVGKNASFYNPSSVAIDASGNTYVADSQNNKIRKITPSGVVSTLAGSGNAGNADGTGENASFNSPFAIALDAFDNVYVADLFNNKVRKITPAGIVSTIAGSGVSGSTDGQGANASFSGLFGIVLDVSGNIYVTNNSLIRKITPSGLVSTFAGSSSPGNTDGVGVNAKFDGPRGICIDATGNLYVADTRSQKIRKITPSAVVTTLAGNGEIGYSDGLGANASFNYPSGIAVDGSGNIYVTDNKTRDSYPLPLVFVFTALAQPIFYLLRVRQVKHHLKSDKD